MIHFMMALSFMSRVSANCHRGLPLIMLTLHIFSPNYSFPSTRLCNRFFIFFCSGAIFLGNEQDFWAIIQSTLNLIIMEIVEWILRKFFFDFLSFPIHHHCHRPPAESKAHKLHSERAEVKVESFPLHPHNFIYSYSHLGCFTYNLKLRLMLKVKVLVCHKKRNVAASNYQEKGWDYQGGFSSTFSFDFHSHYWLVDRPLEVDRA